MWLGCAQVEPFNSGFFDARDMNRFGGGVQGPCNLHRFAHIRLNPVLIVQLISSLGRRIVQDKLTRRFGEMRPVEYAALLLCNTCDSFHWRLNTVQVFVCDLALERGRLSAGELNDCEDAKTNQHQNGKSVVSVMTAICHIDLRSLCHLGLEFCTTIIPYGPSKRSA